MDNVKKKITLSVTRYYVRVMAFTVLGMVIGAFATSYFISIRMTYAPHSVNVTEGISEDAMLAETKKFPSLSKSVPVRLLIPTINLDTTFVAPLGLNIDQTVSVPDSYVQVGWYKYGVTPGEIGPAVILGHVDSVEGPAIFYQLGQLKKGDEVNIEREDGTTATFIVTDTERVQQNKFPTEKVYGPIDFAGLRLITCSGVYNRGDMRYSHNLIVYAELKAQ